MSDLQLGLLILGAAAVIGVLLYNRIQERAVRRHAQQAFGSGHADVLLGEQPAAGPVRPASGRDHPAPPPGALPDERVDYVVTLRIPVGVPAASALEAWRPLEQRFGRRVILAGSDGTGWRALATGELGSFSSLRAAFQMVSRSGVVSDAELIEFRTAAENFGARLRAECAAPEMRAALDAARELDRFCADHDIQVALHAVGEGLDGAQVDAAMHELADAPYQVSRREDGVTLLLDMPRTPNVPATYAAMARAAVGLATRL
ncbi:MAG TPA: hypothetical protein VEB41_06045, partial [Burkholderiales bacterium]|nr:hypothetical protein [Burkholderiales bacterium]